MTDAEAAIWEAVGDVRDPAIRAEVVGAIADLETRRKSEAIERARDLGLPVREERPDGGVRELIGWEGDLPLYYATRNANAAISTASDLIRVAPYSADGAGWTLGIWDGGGVRPTHQEFGGRVTIKDGSALNNHATHVGGTIGAAGVTASAIGMARAVQIDSYDWNHDGSEMSSRGASYGGESDKIYISNHSYGYITGWYRTGGSSPAWIWYGSGTDASAYAPQFGQYNSYVRDIDTRAFNLPYYLIFWAAGNDRSDNPATGSKVALDPNNTSTMVDYDPALHPPGDGVYKSGYDSIGYNALAKNVLTVGAVNDAVTSGERDLSKATMTTFSSWGPTDDGRIKPDVVANGASLYSTSSGGDSSYTWMSGTSMAAPNAAGTAQQILGYYESVFPGHYLRASTLKGLLIHTADDLGTPGPNYRFGWGLINAKAAADLIAAMADQPEVPRMIEQQLTSSITTRTHAFTWDGVSPLKVTICWTDPAGSSTTAHDSRIARLVNNLHLRVDGPEGSQHFPWVMPFVGDWSVASMSDPATTGVNHTDNVLQVYIDEPPAAGTYQAVVYFSGSLANNQQHYSLLIDGSAPSAPNPQSVSPDSGESGTLDVTISGTSFANDATVAFYRDGMADVSADIVSLSPTTIECSLDVASMAQGLWSIRVTNPDGQSGTLPAAFAVVGTLFSQDFDPEAPGWSASANIGSTYWALTDSQSHTPPNAWFAPGPDSKNTDNLLSEGISLSATAQKLRLHFWHQYNTEVYDGCLLEISPNDGLEWHEIGAGGSGTSFVRGGYTTTVQGRTGSPHNRSEFFGKAAWTGNSGNAFSEVVIALDSALYAGKTLRVRWRLGTDNSVASDGWYVDSVRISGYDTDNAAPMVVTAASADPATVTNATTALSVEADDDGGEAALTYTWSVDDTPEHPVSFSDNGTNDAKVTTATFSAIGDYTFVVTVADLEGLTATSAVSVAVVATPASITVTPDDAEVETAKSVLFTAVASDSFGHPLDPQPDFAWSVSGGGTIDENGLLSAGTEAGGPHTVTADAQDQQGTAKVTVVQKQPAPTVIMLR